ncbi:MAG: hypothetical protein LUD29_06015 [Clostridia bacterium]|nr:hypothetical protein [Clostridia bacterium]
MGHGLDEVVGWTFNPETSTVTITFECMSDGEITVKTVAITEANYTTTVYEGYVHVEYNFESTVAAENGTSYPFHVCGDDVDIEALPDGEDDDYYSYSVASHSTCEAEGEDVYTYGRGKGDIVRVTTPKDHDWKKKEYDMDGMTFTYYECQTCQKIVLNEGDEDEYDDVDVLAGDIAAKESYEETKREALAALDDAMTEILENLAESFEEGSDEYETIKEVVEAVFSEYKDFTEGTEYESQTDGGSDDYLDGFIGDIEGIIDEAVLNATQTSTEMSTDYILDVLYQEIIESGKYEGSALDALDAVFEELKRDLERITVESVDEIVGLYDSFIERAEAALDAVIPSTAFVHDGRLRGCGIRFKLGRTFLIRGLRDNCGRRVQSHSRHGLVRVCRGWRLFR